MSWDSFGNAKIGNVLGENVRNIYLNNDQSDLYIESDYRVYKFPTEGDCCSETWFADIIGVDALIDDQIVGVEIKFLPNPDDNRSRQESDSAYGFSFKTDRGICDFVFRNSSNGYYGGWLNDVETFDKDDFKLPEGCVKITEDYSA